MILKTGSWFPDTVHAFRTACLSAIAVAFASANLQAEEISLENVIIQTADTPRLRFEQTNASGKTPQIWDVQGNESELSIIDTTRGTVPYRISYPRAAKSIELFSNGSTLMGIGAGAFIDNQLAQKCLCVSIFHEVGFPVARFQVSDAPGAFLEIRNGISPNPHDHFVPTLRGQTATSTAALILEGLISRDGGAAPAIAFNVGLTGGGAVVNRPLVDFQNNGFSKAKIAANGDFTATSFNSVSSRTLKDKISVLDPRKAAEALRLLTPVQFVYKDDPAADKRVGFIAEDVPDIVANADGRSVPIMDVFALVTRVVKDQQQAGDHLQKTLDQQRKRLDAQSKSARQNQQIIGKQQAAIAAERAANDRQKKVIGELMTRLIALEAEVQDSNE